MSVSTLHVTTAKYGIVFLEATGGNRRERAAKISAYARRHNLGIAGKPIYSETYGFLTSTEIRYVPKP